MKRILSLTAMLTVGMAVLAQNIKVSPVSGSLQLEALGMSANHRYICGLNVANYKAFVWDTETNLVVENEGDYANNDFRCVANDGRAFGIQGSDDMVTVNATTFDQDGKISYIDQELSQIFAVTPDGSMAVGCLLDEMWLPSACVWKEGKRIMLPCPTKEECGIDNDGANAQFVSADGKTIAGYLQDWHSSRPAIVWHLQEDGSYKADVISRDVWELNYGEGKKYMKFEPLGLSQNGKWLCLAGQKEADGNMPTPEFMIRMNLETGEITESATPDIEYFDVTTDNCYPSSIANDGTCVGSAKDLTGFQRGVIWKADAAAPELLATALPTIERLQTYDEFLHIPVAISSDANYVAGFGCPVTIDATGSDYHYESYLISMEGTDGIASLQVARHDDTPCYNMQGQRVDASKVRGIITRNGKKVMVR